MIDFVGFFVLFSQISLYLTKENMEFQRLCPKLIVLMI